jgi:hypothetical protein
MATNRSRAGSRAPHRPQTSHGGSPIKRLKLGVPDQCIKPDQDNGEGQENEGGAAFWRLDVSAHRRLAMRVTPPWQLGMMVVAAALPSTATKALERKPRPNLSGASPLPIPHKLRRCH